MIQLTLNNFLFVLCLPMQTFYFAVDEESERKTVKSIPFTGSGRRLNGKPSTEQVEPIPFPVLKHHEPKSDGGCNDSPTNSRRLVFGSNATDGKRKVFLTPYRFCYIVVVLEDGSQKLTYFALQNPSNEDPTSKEENKFKAFSGKKYLLK